LASHGAQSCKFIGVNGYGVFSVRIWVFKGFKFFTGIGGHYFSFGNKVESIFSDLFLTEKCNFERKNSGESGNKSTKE
jgi:hypothetical protein